MKFPLLIFIAAIVVISGCKSSTEPQTNKLGPSITVTSNWSPSLVGGGRWFNGPDTGVWYDATLSFTLNNSSGSTKDISYKLEIGEFKNGKFQQGSGELFYDGDSVISGSYKVGTSTTFDLTPTIGVGRKNGKDWSYAYGYRLTLTDIATNDSYVNEGSFDGSKPENRFRGIVYTTETSPDSLGVLDAPDDGDWSHKANDGIFARHLYPNPAFRGGSFGWVAQSSGAQVTFSLNRTAKDTVFSQTTGLLEAGEYTYDVSFDGVKSGMYRMFFTAKLDGKTYTSHGDVIISN